MGTYLFKFDHETRKNIVCKTGESEEEFFTRDLPSILDNMPDVCNKKKIINMLSSGRTEFLKTEEQYDKYIKRSKDQKLDRYRLFNGESYAYYYVTDRNSTNIANAFETISSILTNELGISIQNRWID